MGNPDKIVIINDEDVIKISGKDYTVGGGKENEIIKIAIDKWYIQIEGAKMNCDFPEEIEEAIKTIRIFSL